MRRVVSVTLTKKLATDLDVLSKETGMSKTAVAQKALGEFLWEYKFRRMKKRLCSQTKIVAKEIQEDYISKSPQFSDTR